ncbi:hypothetical protein [Riemerella anatipestifer]|uniref:hypothetical protein n=1 Tax=Riemerella anatipestifer TaxID=34085 RepID=UPI001372F356|nr:hypothetical protein [Riemerella anatipestifer]MBT0550307.1 hypothetical protein [Riemerella anatipestifer]MBT0556999.1 hypothetical protein [Riemerella anatipestifer]MBT0561067.1 hypothetical protein [Riemerella anatipestifer]MCW0518299.1 hypothetical protein [Riemerella anatipestifer]NAV17364.1 hypothetical protein [Riemerella anatipestifer]
MSNLESTTIASIIAEKAAAEAKKIFENYPKLEEVYITSDLQGFKELEKAENQATYLTDKKVHYFQRKDLSQPSVPVLEETNKQNDASADDSQDANLEEGDEGNSDDKAKQDTGLDNVENQADEETKTEDDERAELMAKYEVKHGKKAPHNIGLEKLRASVED